MGLSAGLYVIPAEKFALARAKGTWRRYRWHECEPSFDLGRTWSKFDLVFQRRQGHLRYAIEGEIDPHPDDLDFKFVSPEVVPKVADALAALPPEAVVAEIVAEADQARWQMWSEAERDGHRRMLADTFEELRSAYRTAADRGAAIGILMC